MNRSLFGSDTEAQMSEEERELLHNDPAVAMTPEENKASLERAHWQEVHGLGEEIQTAQVELV